MSDNPLISIQNLSVEFKTEAGVVGAVNDISFSVNKGITSSIVGESGSGKSVTAFSVMGLISSPPGKVTGGKIFFHTHAGQQDLLQLPENKMRRLRGGLTKARSLPVASQLK